MRIRVSFTIAMLLLLFSIAGPIGSTATILAQQGSQPAPTPTLDRQRVAEVDFLGEVGLPVGFTAAETPVGGLSGITYDTENEVYYAISDDRSQNAPARFYTLTIDLSDGTLQRSDITFETTTTLLAESGEAFPELSLDPEGIALTAAGTLFISSEGDANATPPIAPFVNEFSLDGELLDELPVPDKFLPDPANGQGIRNNLAFESLTLTPDEHFLIVATENALAQDGPAADLDQTSLSRIIKYDLTSREPVQEYVYVTEPVAEAPEPETEFRTNGLTDLLALDNHGTFLALERSFSIGKGNIIKLFEVRTQGALDVSEVEDLMWEAEEIPFAIDPPVVKRLLVDLAEFGLTPDNLEGLTFGPILEDGRQSLIVVADDNFSPIQRTQFVALALTLETIPIALPSLETHQAVDEAQPPAAALAGDSDDPAIWVHPTDPDQSLILATMKDGGMIVMDLAGEVLETILPAEFGEIRYNNVDLIYNFELDGEPVDLAVASDRANDTLAIYQIDPDSRQLIDVTAADIIETIFGEDDGEATAYGLATYTSPQSGQAYAFVSQADGNLVAQLALTDNGAGQVEAEVVRTISLPEISDDVADSQSEGMVVDRELGFLYVALEAGTGIFKFRAEPAGGDDPDPIRVIDTHTLLPDVEGLTIYYGSEGDGYLLVSSQGDSTYAVFERSGDNDYLGRFAVGDSDGIDQANESDGADVLNVALGEAFPNGLLVVQDGANDPQFVAENDEEIENRSTNFKFVPWENVANAFAEPLLIEPEGYDPRQ